MISLQSNQLYTVVTVVKEGSRKKDSGNSLLCLSDCMEAQDTGKRYSFYCPDVNWVMPAQSNSYSDQEVSFL